MCHRITLLRWAAKNIAPKPQKIEPYVGFWHICDAQRMAPMSELQP
jgi:hypothetical protein